MDSDELPKSIFSTTGESANADPLIYGNNSTTYIARCVYVLPLVLEKVGCEAHPQGVGCVILRALNEKIRRE